MVYRATAADNVIFTAADHTFSIICEVTYTPPLPHHCSGDWQQISGAS